MRRLLTIVVFGVYLSVVEASAEATKKQIPNFTAEGIFSRKTLAPDGSVQSQNDGKFLFDYTNGVWEIQISDQKVAGLHANPAAMAKTVLNCRQIPGGIRWFSTTKDVNDPAAVLADPRLAKAAEIATAFPIAYPPPQMVELLACWLSLCPDPELPEIDSMHIHRFLEVELSKNPTNVGSFVKSYLTADQTFLSQLHITNNGVIFDSSGETFRLEPPLDKGFCELTYDVAAVTNCSGIPFPSETTLCQYLPVPNAKSAAEVYPRQVTRLNIQKVEFGAPAAFIMPPSLAALDRRVPDLPEKPQMQYLISNDTWPSPTNSNIVAYAAHIRQRAAHQPHKGNRALPAAVLLILLVSFPCWLLLRRKSGLLR